MNSNEKILTLHPDGKKGVRIDTDKYYIVRDAILSALSGKDSLTHTELMNSISKLIAKSFDGSLSWYSETVKLDLEARKVIRRKKDENLKKFVYELIRNEE